jgi:hypothetical protein
MRETTYGPAWLWLTILAFGVAVLIACKPDPAEYEPVPGESLPRAPIGVYAADRPVVCGVCGSRIGPGDACYWTRPDKTRAAHEACMRDFPPQPRWARGADSTTARYAAR